MSQQQQQSSSQDIVLAFDAYGTLLSTESISTQLAEHFGAEKAGIISATWRKYQLEYTWRLNSMKKYEPFTTVTTHALQHALAESHVQLDDTAIVALMRAYDSLQTFPDVIPGLKTLATVYPSMRAVVFSNGTRPMVTGAVRQSPDLGPHAGVFTSHLGGTIDTIASKTYSSGGADTTSITAKDENGIVVVDDVKRYKPAPEVYYHLADAVGKSQDRKQMGEIWLVSGNPFDVCGARAVGMNAVWIDRAGNGWQDAMAAGAGEAGRPTIVASGIDEAIKVVARRYGY